MTHPISYTTSLNENDKIALLLFFYEKNKAIYEIAYRNVWLLMEEDLYKHWVSDAYTF